MRGISFRPLRCLVSCRIKRQRRILRNQLLEVGQPPRSQGRQSEDHTGHAQRSHDGRTHTRLRCPHGVDRGCANRRNHQAKPKPGCHRTDRHLAPVHVSRPAAHQVKTNGGEEQTKHTRHAAGDTTAQPAAQEGTDWNHRGEAQQREATEQRSLIIRNLAPQHRIDIQRDIGHRDNQRRAHQ